MKIGKKLITYVLVLTICFSMFGSYGITAHAATIRTYSTMDAIPEDLAIFETMQKGTISAVNVSGVWYYQFARSGYDTIRVKVTAFMSTSHTNAYLAADNAALSNVVNTAGTKIDRRWNYYVSTKKRNFSVTKPTNGILGSSTTATVSIDEYTTSRWRSLLSIDGSVSHEIIQKTELYNFVKFTYTSKVCDKPFIPVTSTECTKAITPVTATNYQMALVRSLSVNPITPVFELSITNTGNLGAYLGSYTLSGKGSATQGINVSKLVSVGFSTVKIAVETYTAPNIGTLFSLFSLIGDIATLSNPSTGTFNTGLREPLSLKNYFIYRSKYDSPIKLVKYSAYSRDYVQVITYIANSKSSYSGRGTAKLKVVFSFK